VTLTGVDFFAGIDASWLKRVSRGPQVQRFK
jgi:hypothetical protein